MEWLGNIKKAMDNWQKPKEPSASTQTKAMREVTNATASIYDAWGRVATTFQVTYQGTDYLITSAHLTNNSRAQSTGYYDEDSFYFPIIKGNKLAFARQEIINPQGAPCSNNETFSANREYRDITILKLLDERDSEHIALRILEGDPDRAQRLKSLLKSHSLDTKPATGTLTRAITSGFKLNSLDISEEISSRNAPRTASTYSIGYPYDFPDPAYSSIDIKDLSNLPVNYKVKMDPYHSIKRGHSGGYMFDINDKGRRSALGIVTGVDCNLDGYIVNISEVITGLDVLQTKRQVEVSDVKEICKKGTSVWLDPSFIPAYAPPPMPPISTPKPHQCPTKPR